MMEPIHATILPPGHRMMLTRDPDGRAVCEILTEPWSGPALAGMDMPVDQPARCRAYIIAVLAYPASADLRLRAAAARSLDADWQFEAFRDGRLMKDDRPSRRHDLSDHLRVPKRDRERRIGKALRLANRTLQDVEQFVDKRILQDAVEALGGGRGQLEIPAGEHGRPATTIQQPGPRSIRGLARDLACKTRVDGVEESVTNNDRNRRWAAMRHVCHLALAINQAGALPADEKGLQQMLDRAEAYRLFALPALDPPVPAETSVQFRPTLP